MNSDAPQSERLAEGTAAGKAQGAGPDPSCGDFDMRIARDGTWYHEGAPIGRLPLVKLFSTVLHKDENGEFWLITPVEKGRIVVDDAPFTAVELTVEGAGPAQILSFRTNIDDIVTAGPDHPIRVAEDPVTGEPSPYILIRDRLEALILRPVFYHLVELGEEREVDGGRVLGVSSGGSFFPLGALDGRS
jgi:hypothetical protein